MKNNYQLKLLSSRLGGTPIKKENSDNHDESLTGFNDQYRRLLAHGGQAQQDRMIKDKRRTLERSLYYSYQGADIRILENDENCRALINPDKLKQNYDDKILSTPFESNIKAGDIFEWIGTDTYWLVYLQEITELAYFRSEIRRCRYSISWMDNGVEHLTYVAVRGPVETKINSFRVSKIDFNAPNYSLNVLMPGTKENIEHFKRYTTLHLKEDELDVCWRVEATDWISTPGVLELSVVEYYDNKQQDEENKIKQLINIQQNNTKDEDELIPVILGNVFIKPKKTFTYTITTEEDLQWTFNKKVPVKILSEEKDNDIHKITIMWDNKYSGEFELRYGDYSKKIVVESLF